MNNNRLVFECYNYHPAVIYTKNNNLRIEKCPECGGEIKLLPKLSDIKERKTEFFIESACYRQNPSTKTIKSKKYYLHIIDSISGEGYVSRSPSTLIEATKSIVSFETIPINKLFLLLEKKEEWEKRNGLLVFGNEYHVDTMSGQPSK